LFSAVLIGLMTLLSVARTRGKFRGGFLRTSPLPAPRSASGD
jgi:hypothetical protein